MSTPPNGQGTDEGAAEDPLDALPGPQAPEGLGNVVSLAERRDSSRTSQGGTATNPVRVRPVDDGIADGIADGVGGALDSNTVSEAFRATFAPEHLVGMLQAADIHSDDVATQLRWAPLGLTHLCWRNSVVEDWHSDPSSNLGDGAMFMANVATTRIFAEALLELVVTCEIDQWATRREFSEVGAETLSYHLFDAVDLSVDPARRLPHEVTLAEIGRDEVLELRDHAEAQVEGMAEIAADLGADVVLMWLAARGAHACPKWWGGTGWPVHVDRWLGLLDDPAHEWWHGKYPGSPPAPGDDREWLRRTLLTGPDALGVAVADWCATRGAIGYV